MADPFKPSQVFLNAVPPLTATMGRAEREHAAAMLVRVCQVLGDEWQSVEPVTLGRVIRDDLAAGVEPWKSLNTNPFFRPDFHDLVATGFAEWREKAPGTPGGPPIAFTPKGIEALRRWVRAPRAEVAHG